jgi:lysophospholipase L1-like esterase
MDGGLVVTLQGAPAPGPVDVDIAGSSGHGHATFTFDAPTTRVPLTWLAFGASLTQGTQSLGVNQHSQLTGVSAVVARQAGVYLGLPLFADGMLPGLQTTDFTPDCKTTKDQGDFVNGLFTALTDPQTGLIDLSRGRVDPTLAPRDLAIGGSKVDDILHGGSGNIALLEHIVEAPTTTAPGAILEQLDVSQIDRIETIDPDVGFSTDLLANDIDAAVVQSDDLHADLITPLANVQPLLVEIAQRLGALHGQYFIANLAHLTFIPNVTALRAERIAAGLDTAQSFDAKAAMIDAITDQYDDALAQAIAPFPNLHLVDFRAEVEAIRTTGIVAGGETCTSAHFDGLLSLDDLHFTDTGYALYANVFVDAINAQLGSTIAHADIDTVHATDALAPAKLRALGFTCVPPP